MGAWSVKNHKALEMNFRKLVTITCVGIITLAFVTTPLHAKPKEEKSNKGKQKQERINNSKPKVKAPRPEKKNTPQNKPEKFPKPAGIKIDAADRGHIIRKEKDASQSKALRPLVSRRLDRRMEYGPRKNEQKLIRNLNRSLLKLNRSNWSYHPHDDRGQGNSGKVDMLDPFGHDKDSDRKELYGNQGRVIRDPVPEPEPIIPEPEPIIPEPEPEPVIPEPEPEPIIPEPEPEPIIPEPEPEPIIPEPEPDPGIDPNPIPEFPF